MFVFAWTVTTAHAESLVSSGSGTWSGVDGGDVSWSGGTPSPDDDFVIAAGHQVQVEAAVSLTSGSITVEAGGMLSVGAGAVLTPGAQLVVRDGGRYDQLGVQLASCRIQEEPDWNDPDPHVRLPCAARGTAGDWLVFLAEDPPSGLWNGRDVVIGPGLAAGASKPALNRYAWYDITEIAGTLVTYDLDSGSYDESPGVPYQGTRGNATPLPIAASQLSYALQPGRRATQVTVAPSHGSVAAMHADLGSQYLYFTEDAVLASDPERCSGLAAKILHSEDGGAAGDRLYVAGDVTRCRHPALTARIIPGARRGDLVALARPAVLAGRVEGRNTSHVRFESGASVHVRWARFVDLGFATPGVVSPPLRRNCNLCFLQSATSPGATLSGYFEDVEIAFPEAGSGATNDTAVLHFDSLTGGPGDYRHPDVGLLDLAGFSVARLHIHDSRNAAETGGGHGIYIDGVKNLGIDGARIERISDDLFGSNLAGNETGTASDANSFDVRRLLLYEGIAERDLSQQCFEPGVLFGDGATATGVHNYARQAQAIRASDVIAIGCYQQAVNVVGLGAQLDRVVSGGRFDASRTPPFRFYLLPGSGVPPQEFPNLVRNAVLTTYAEDGTRDIRSPVVIARIEDSVIFGDEQSGDPTHRYAGFQACVRTFWYHDGASDFALDGNSRSDNVWGPLRDWEDCAFLSASAGHLAARFSNLASPHTLRLRRLLYLQAAAWNLSWGPLGNITTESFATVDLDGAFLSTEVVGTKDFDANPGGSLQDVCFESLNDAATDFHGYASSTTLSLPALLPDVRDEPTVAALAGDPGSTDPCERAKPVALGLAEIGMAHVLLGDFALSELDPILSSRAALVRLRTEEPPPPPAWGCGIGPELLPALALLWRAGWRRRCERGASPMRRAPAAAASA